MTKATPSMSPEKKASSREPARGSNNSTAVRARKRMWVLLAVVIIAVVVVVAITIAVIVALVVLKKPQRKAQGADVDVVSDEDIEGIRQNHSRQNEGSPHWTTSEDSVRTGIGEKSTVETTQASLASLKTQTSTPPPKVPSAQELPHPPTPTTCQRTARDITGPYYVEGAPLVHRVCSQEPSQKALIVHGFVFAKGCRMQISDVKIEIWQAGVDGQYKNNCRGHVVTNSTGYFRFSTVHPGHYLLNSGSSQFRAAHFHYKLSHSSYLTLVTQQYFRGDDVTTGQVSSLMSTTKPIDFNYPDGDEYVAFNFIL